MASLRDLLKGTQKVLPNTLNIAPDGNNSPLLQLDIQPFKGINNLIVRSKQKHSGKHGVDTHRAVTRDGIYSQTIRFSLKGSNRNIKKDKPSTSKDRALCTCQCFTGDTKVILTNGTTATFKELSGRDHFYVYSLNEENKIVISDAVQCELKEKDAQLVKVVLDNGFEIKCTLDHKFRLKDGSYKEAKDLKSDDSLAALYRKYSETRQVNGYEQVKGPIDKWKFSHRLADEYNERLNEVKDISEFDHDKPMVRHHIDFNKLNNNPDNILRMGRKEHFKYHSDNTREWMRVAKQDKIKFKQRMNKRNTTWRNNGHHIKTSNNMKKNNPMYNQDTKDKMVNTFNKLGIYEANSIRMTKNNPMSNKETSAKVAKTLRKRGDKKRQPIIDWINSLSPQTVIINKDITTKLGCQSTSIFGSMLKDILIHEEDIRNKVIITKEARNKPIHLTITDGSNNHKVKEVVFLDEREDVYCLTAPEYSNFAIVADNSESINSGVFVHNCSAYYYYYWFANKKAKAHEGANFKAYSRKTPPPPVGRAEKNPEKIPGLCKHLVFLAKELRRKRKIT